MRRLCICLLVAGALFFASACGAANRGRGGFVIGSKLPPPATEIDKRLVDANIRFSFKLFNEIMRDEASENIVICPASIAMALAMTYNGADGDTKDAMAEVLELNGMSIEEVNEANADLLTILQNPDPNVMVQMANSLWAREGVGFYREFLDTNKKFYDAYIEELDFDSPQAARTINGWVRERTEGKIDKLVDDEISGNTVLFLLNALYFKGEWTNKFDPELTQTMPFALEDGTRRDCSMMFRRGSYPYYRGENFQAVSIPYGKGRLSMVVVLPDEGISLKDFCSSVNLETWKSRMDALAEAEGEIGLPKFKAEYEIELREILTALGMGVAFDPSRANFGRMRPVDPERNLYIYSVKHKTFVETTEEGTEAGAGTAVEIRTKGAPASSFRMIVERPFLFAIRDNLTGVILLMGAVVNP